MPTFKVRGQIYHRAGSLLPPHDAQHKFLQIYFSGCDEDELKACCSISSNVRRPIVSQLQEMLHSNNRLVRLLKTSLEMMPSDTHRIVIHADKKPAGQNKRRYNAPTVEEVAIVIEGDQFHPRDIVLHRYNDQLTRIAETHQSYNALQYPLIFWNGADEYHFENKLIDPVSGQEINKKCSSMSYFRIE